MPDGARARGPCEARALGWGGLAPDDGHEGGQEENDSQAHEDPGATFRGVFGRGRSDDRGPHLTRVHVRGDPRIAVVCHFLSTCHAVPLTCGLSVGLRPTDGGVRTQNVRMKSETSERKGLKSPWSSASLRANQRGRPKKIAIMTRHPPRPPGGGAFCSSIVSPELAEKA
jgi:hypothetical protein